MRRGSWFFFVLLLGFWVVISGEISFQYMVTGVPITLATLWLWGFGDSDVANTLSGQNLLLLGRCLILLVGYVIESNIIVARILLFSRPQVSPTFIEMDPDIRSGWGRTLLATCITITPGTVTIDVDPETGRFIVHALTEELAMGLPYWRLIHEIKKLETRIQRGAEHAVDTDRSDDLDSIGAVEGDYRPDSR